MENSEVGGDSFEAAPVGMDLPGPEAVKRLKLETAEAVIDLTLPEKPKWNYETISKEHRRQKAEIAALRAKITELGARLQATVQEADRRVLEADLLVQNNNLLVAEKQVNRLFFDKDVVRGMLDSAYEIFERSLREGGTNWALIDTMVNYLTICKYDGADEDELVAKQRRQDMLGI